MIHKLIEYIGEHPIILIVAAQILFLIPYIGYEIKNAEEEQRPSELGDDKSEKEND